MCPIDKAFIDSNAPEAKDAKETKAEESSNAPFYALCRGNSVCHVCSRQITELLCHSAEA
jgi:hypothetical protein